MITMNIDDYYVLNSSKNLSFISNKHNQKMSYELNY